MHDDAAAAVAMGIDEVGDRRLDPLMRKRRGDEAALPDAVARFLPVLQSAAAAGAEIGADRRDAVGRRRDIFAHIAPIAVAGDDDGFAGQRVRNIYLSALGLRDAIALMADAVDDDALALSHAGLR